MLVYKILILAACLLFAMAALISGQRPKIIEPTSPPPKSETFQTRNDIVFTWRLDGCGVYSARPEHGCHKNDQREDAARASVISLYDSDGTLWWRAGLLSSDPEPFWPNTKKGFEPFAYDRTDPWPTHIFLRMAGESLSWFKVEVNETTRETKYVSKADPSWADATWSFWLKKFRIVVSPANLPLRTEPDGDIIEATDPRRSNSGSVEKLTSKVIDVSGDWVHISVDVNGATSTGWSRWRKDRDVLVKTVY